METVLLWLFTAGRALSPADGVQEHTPQHVHTSSQARATCIPLSLQQVRERQQGLLYGMGTAPSGEAYPYEIARISFLGSRPHIRNSSHGEISSIAEDGQHIAFHDLATIPIPHDGTGEAIVWRASDTIIKVSVDSELAATRKAPRYYLVPWHAPAKQRPPPPPPPPPPSHTHIRHRRHGSRRPDRPVVNLITINGILAFCYTQYHKRSR